MISDRKACHRIFAYIFEPVAARSDPAANELRLVGIEYLCIHVTAHAIPWSQKASSANSCKDADMFPSSQELDLTFVMFFCLFHSHEKNRNDEIRGDMAHEQRGTFEFASALGILFSKAEEE